MTDAIRELAKLGKAADEADEEDRDYGYELYVQHELNGGREPEYSGCWHTESVYVVDGHKGRITTGNTLVWEFCTDCGSMIGDGPSEFYSELHVDFATAPKPTSKTPHLGTDTRKAMWNSGLKLDGGRFANHLRPTKPCLQG